MARSSKPITEGLAKGLAIRRERETREKLKALEDLASVESRAAFQLQRAGERQDFSTPTVPLDISADLDEFTRRSLMGSKPMNKKDLRRGYRKV